MYFEIVGEVTHVETFAVASSIKEIARLRKLYGRGHWRKRKRIARVRMEDGVTRLAEVHWYEAHGIGRKEFKIKRYIDKAMRASGKQFVVCLKNKGYEVSLERRKIYQVLPDPEAAKHRQVRVIDESGEDYLYPQAFFAPIELSQPIRRAVLAAV